MRDKRIRSRPGESKALQRHNVRAFCLTGSGDQTSWDMLQLLVKQWPNIEAKLRDHDGPFIYSVTTQGLKRLV
jgi:hypothetical protein